MSEDVGTVPLEKLQNVRQLEALARACTLLALMVSPSAADYEDYCLMAYTYLKRIWEVRREAAPCSVPSPWQEPTHRPGAHGPRLLVQPLGGGPSPHCSGQGRSSLKPTHHPCPSTTKFPQAMVPRASSCEGDSPPMLASACPLAALALGFQNFLPCIPHPHHLFRGPYQGNSWSLWFLRTT